MTPTMTVQARNPEDVLLYYQNREIAGYAIWVKNQFVLDFQDDDMERGATMLSDWMDLIVRNRSAAIYTLRLYKEFPEDGLTDKTPSNGNFNFRFKEYDSDFIPGVAGGRRGVEREELKLLIDEVKAMRLELKAIKDEQDQDDDDPEEDTMGKIGAIINNPQLAPIIQAIGLKLGQVIAGIGQHKQIAGIPGDTTINPPEMNVTDTAAGPLNKTGQGLTNDQKIDTALEILGSTPDMASHLYKLAMIKKLDPNKFNFYITALKYIDI